MYVQPTGIATSAKSVSVQMHHYVCSF